MADIEIVRRFLGTREHHPQCDSRLKPSKPCDCYAQARSEAHEALDRIERAIIVHLANIGRK